MSLFPNLIRALLVTQIFVVCPLLAQTERTGDESTPRLPLRFPDIGQELVVFSYAGDLWRAPVDGGTARRLTAHEGIEIFPKISPDGQWIAFTGEYTGARQVYIVSAQGGTPRQLTFYTDVGRMPARGGFDYWVQDWTADGKILVRCNRTPWGERMGRYCVVDPEGGLETYLPLPHGGSASLSPDGSKIAYTPIDREFRTWKRTRGGRAQDVWIYDLEANESQRITTDRGTDNFPMWSGDTIYFLSDRDDTLNLFAYDTSAGSTRKLTNLDAPDILWPSLGPQGIVFHRDGKLHLFAFADGEVQAIPIRIDSELPETVPRFEDVSDNIASASLSPSGQRVLFEARGELFAAPRKDGPTRNLSRTSGVRESDPSWSPDGRWIAYFSDASGEYELYLRPTDGENAPRQLTRGSSSWMFQPVWSPDSKRLAWSDSERRLRAIQIDEDGNAANGGRVIDIDRGSQGNLTGYRFSPDSEWLVYQSWHPSSLQGIAVYSFQSGQSMMLGDGLTNDRNPTWSDSGDYLFFLSSRDYQPRFSDLEFDFVYDRSVRIFAAPLSRSAEALFPPKSDEEEAAEEGEKGEEKKAPDAEASSTEAPTPVQVEADGFVGRTIALPGLEAGGYGSLTAVEGAVFFLHSTGNGGGPSLMRYDLEGRKADQVLENVQGYELSADGKRLLYRSRGDWGVADAKAGLSAGEGRLDLSGLRLKIDPRAEWRQMFDDGWRIFRDFFYDPNMHGFDWQALGERYSALVAGIGHRSELDFIFGEMIGELEAGHTYVVGGEESEVERIEGGKLGAELALDQSSGRYRLEDIFQGENWDPAYRSPLLEPGVDAREGDYVLAIDGVELRYPENPYRLLEGKADQLVTLRLAATSEGADERQALVRTVADEGNLRYIDWVKSRMELVERLSGGRVGYLHLPDTAIDGNRMLQKLFYGQARKPALIIDDRYNGGGFIPDTMIDYFDRKTMSYWARRDIDSTRTPGFAHNGPKAMLVNGYSSSGGDALPYYFRQAGLGKLIGTRTWGGLIGISGAPPLVDGGTVLPPTFRIYDRDGEWVVENEGVEPDIEVFDLPEGLLDGGDPSIEKAVEVLLEELLAGDGGPPERPSPPDLSGPP